MREACLAARLLHHAQHAAIALESNQQALLDKHGASGCVPLQNVVGLSQHISCLYRADEPRRTSCLLSVLCSISACTRPQSARKLASLCVFVYAVYVHLCMYKDAQYRFGKTNVTAEGSWHNPKALDVVCAFRQEAQDLMTTAVAVATARAQATADAATPPSSSSPANPDIAAASPVEPDIAATLAAVCQVATNALEVILAFLDSGCFL